MANVTSSINTNSHDLDPVVLVSTGASKLKRAVPGSDKTASGVTPNTAALEVGTHIDDAAFTVATDVVMAIGAMADDTSSDSVTEGDVGVVRMSLARALHVVNVADTATLTSVASQDTNITILAANANRIGATIFNNDTGPLYLKFGATATATTSNTVMLAAGGYYELPAPVYRGIIDGIWTSSSTGACNITELT